MDRAHSLSVAAFKIPFMPWVDVIDSLDEVMPRQWRSKLVGVLAVLCLVWPSGVQHAVLWYATVKAEQVTSQFMEIMTPAPLPSPAVEPRSPSGAPGDAKAKHRKHEIPR